jgi:hypothetical protein
MSEEVGWKFKSKFNVKSLDFGEIIQHLLPVHDLCNAYEGADM